MQSTPQLLQTFIPRPVRISVVAALVGLSTPSAHAAVEFFGVTKGERFQQTSDAAPPSPSDFFGFMTMTASSSADLGAAQVTTNMVVPSPLSPFVLTPVYPGAFTFYKSETTLANLDTDFPNNALYTFSISGGTLGAQNTSLLVPPINLFPSKVPSFSGTTFNQLQGMNPAAPFNFNWSGFTPAAEITTSSILFDIQNISGDPAPLGPTQAPVPSPRSYWPPTHCCPAPRTTLA